MRCETSIPYRRRSIQTQARDAVLKSCTPEHLHLRPPPGCGLGVSRRCRGECHQGGGRAALPQPTNRRHAQTRLLRSQKLCQWRDRDASCRLPSATAAAEYLNHLQTISKYPLLIVGEQEHGSARNFAGGTEFPAYMALGATRSQELAYLFGKINTLEGRAVGYNWISCPTLDVNIDGENPIINTRSLGERPPSIAGEGVARI